INGQKDLIGFLEKEKASGNVLDHTSFWIFNGFSLKATPEIIKELSSRNDVETITEDFPISPPVSFTSTPVQSDSPYTWNIERVRAPQVWDMGYSGSGVVVGIFDTGVDVTHPDLAEKYRGGDNSWFDPHGEHAVPVDAAGSFSGHGTHVAGIIMGGDSSGKYIGVAPGARWIAARIWNDAGEEASSKEVHEIFQWFMDPDFDPETDDAPDVVNCSWGFKLLDTFPWCLPDFQDDIKAWRIAGIIPVFSAGNSGPRFFTGESPGNYSETIAVGATDFSDNIAFFSSRGPGNCNLSIFPDISAPGVAIYSSTLDEKHRTLSGTSAAVPHVVGTIALMLDANPNLSIEAIESILRATAKPLGCFYPNFTYGWGQVDALVAVNAVMP
ncbi:MAG: S8 family serine peptidase, partial [Deltaproteobacteria bacterium]|nr:S8 family serine peptidase [Deltaproteobacteria bacterium]